MRTPQQIIDQLASKELSFGCYIEYSGNNEGAHGKIRRIGNKVDDLNWQVGKLQRSWFWIHNSNEILGHPVLIGDVLEKIINEIGLIPLKGSELMLKWLPLGFTKSLQEIIDEEGWEVACINCNKQRELVMEIGNCCMKKKIKKILKSPSARALFKFLDEVLPN